MYCYDVNNNYWTEIKKLITHEKTSCYERGTTSCLKFTMKTLSSLETKMAFNTRSYSLYCYKLFIFVEIFTVRLVNIESCKK